MKATDLLKKQHKVVSDLFAQIETTDGKDKLALFDELAANLVAHDGIERKIFYPACEKKMGMTELLGEALVEHGVVEFSLARADENRRNKSFDHFVKVLKEMVEHHVKEEEKEFFPKVTKAFDAEALEALGEKMEAAFEEAKAADFRTPLWQNLRQVIDGALKTSPKATTKAPKRVATKSKPNGKTSGARLAH